MVMLGLTFETRFPLKHKGLLIQFEALCTLRYETKIDNRISFHQGRHCILEDVKPELHGYQESPIRQIIIADVDEEAVGYSINPGSVTYPSFTLQIPGNPHLPAPFKNSYGNMVYRLVVYMKSNHGIYTEVGEKIMRFNGHHNLLDNVEAMKSISSSQSLKKSMFSRKKLVEVVFSVDSSGFLPGELIKYDASGKRDSPKKRFAIVSVKEKEDFEPQPELAWVDNLNIRENQEPTFTAHSMYNVTYCIQYKVKILDHGTVKGQAPIYIGTTRDPIQTLISNANGLDVPFQGLRRRGSASSTHSVRSHNSAATTYSLPPAYSQLSSRIPSVETLPPTYDEAELWENTQGGGLTIEVPTLYSPVGEQDTTDDGATEEETEINESDSN